MTWLVRASTFFVCCFLGFLAADISWITWNSAESRRGVAEVEELSDLGPPVQSRTGIKVMYAGWQPATASTVASLKFVIYNGTYLPISYMAHTPDNPWPQLKIDDKEQQPLYGCGTGIQTFYIFPRGSAEVLVTGWDFSASPESGRTVTAGFYLRTALEDEGVVYSSEPFILPEEFRLSILNR